MKTIKPYEPKLLVVTFYHDLGEENHIIEGYWHSDGEWCDFTGNTLSERLGYKVIAWTDYPKDIDTTWEKI